LTKFVYFHKIVHFQFYPTKVWSQVLKYYQNIHIYHLTPMVISHSILVSQSSFYFRKISKFVYFLTCFKTNFNPNKYLCLITLRSSITLHLIKFRCLETIGILKSTQKYQKSGFPTIEGPTRPCNWAHGCATYSRENTHGPCHMAHSHATMTTHDFSNFRFSAISRIKFWLSIRFQFRFHKVFPITQTYHILPYNNVSLSQLT